MKFDFSEFHPLDHWAGSWRCWSLPGGPQRHIKFWWHYQGPGYHEEDWEDVTDEFMPKKMGPCVHGNPCRESLCVEYGRWEKPPDLR